MELPGSERSGEVLEVTHGGEGRGLSSCLMPRMSCGCESYPVSIVGGSGAARLLWGWGTISWLPLWGLLRH